MVCSLFRNFLSWVVRFGQLRGYSISFDREENLKGTPGHTRHIAVCFNSQAGTCLLPVPHEPKELSDRVIGGGRKDRNGGPQGNPSCVERLLRQDSGPAGPICHAIPFGDEG